MIRVLVVDDSPTVREMLCAILSTDPAVSIAGVAEDGEQGVMRTIELCPDLVTMDIRMPRMDGLAAIRQIMRDRPTPIVVVCSRAATDEVDVGFEALKAGALDVLDKPTTGLRIGDFAREFVGTIKLMAEVKVVRQLVDDSGELRALRPAPPAPERLRPSIDAVGICSSTGGPAALEYLFRHLPASFPAPIAVVQHITEGFLIGLVEWLDRSSPLRVKIAEDGERAQPGSAYFAPEGRHLTFADDGRFAFSDASAVRSHRPSGELLFESLAARHGSRGLGVMLTGMGEDGADGLATLASLGGVTLAQDEATSVVYGMPRAVVERGAATEVLALDAIPERMLYRCYLGAKGESTS